MEQLADIVGRKGAVCRDIGQRDVLAEVVVNIQKDLLNVRTGNTVDVGEQSRILIGR